MKKRNILHWFQTLFCWKIRTYTITKDITITGRSNHIWDSGQTTQVPDSRLELTFKKGKNKFLVWTGNILPHITTCQCWSTSHSQKCWRLLLMPQLTKQTPFLCARHFTSSTACDSTFPAAARRRGSRQANGCLSAKNDNSSMFFLPTGHFPHISHLGIFNSNPLTPFESKPVHGVVKVQLACVKLIHSTL